MDWILPLIGGLGIGSLLKGLVDHFLNKKLKTDDRLYQEKREIYFGLIDAMHQADIHPSVENAKAFGNWTNRCKLFGSPEVIAAAQACIKTSADVTGDACAKAFEALFSAMREDIRK
jgi:hypothetical protein